jgi:hypothetical protein
MAHGNTGRRRPDLSARNRAAANPDLPANKWPSEFSIWRTMLARCHRETAKDYARYGGRGIVVCDRWRASFDAFLEDMGPRPSQSHSLDRVNNGAGYGPDNCEWRTAKAQARNRRSNTRIAHDGKELTLTEWSERTGICRVLIAYRLKAGWPVRDALTLKPSRSKNHRHGSKAA